MATRDDWRTALTDKLVGLEDSGYGDFEYEEQELNTYLDLAVARLFPALYRRAVDDALDVVEYGSAGYGSVDTTFPERVFLVEDATERTAVFAWEVRPTSIVKLDTNFSTVVNVYYYDAYTFPDNDDDDIDIPAMWKPVVILGALVEALESRQDSGVRGDDPPVGNLHEVTLLDRLSNRYERAREDLAMNLPAVTV